MYEVSCRDLGLTDCDFDLMACSLERLELGILAHARREHANECAAAVLADPDSPEREALRERIAAAAHEVAVV